MTSLVRSEQTPDADLEMLRARMASLEAVLSERSADVARVKSSLDIFKIRYRQEVGLLHEELDELERAIDEAEQGERAKRPKSAPGDPAAAPSNPTIEAQPRYTSDAVRRLFRDVAKAIHPDLARDELTRDRRHFLMIEANRAYALGDEEQLRSILQSWENSPEAVQGSDLDATRLRLTRRIAQIEEHLNVCTIELAALKDTPMWKLKAMVDEAAAGGKDLVRDMVTRLKGDIMVARNRLAAIEWQPPSTANADR
ncbi:MAG TPA: hypothetical protein VF456_26890 [Vicinamibacterales bacterium]